MEKISWTSHVSNEEVLSLVQEQRSLVYIIKQRQTNWIRHFDCLLKTVLEGKFEGTWTREKPRKGRCWTYSWNKKTRRSVTMQELKRRAAHRVEWHHHQLNLPWACRAHKKKPKTVVSFFNVQTFPDLIHPRALSGQCPWY